jgi:hypothetical protein
MNKATAAMTTATPMTITSRVRIGFTSLRA